MRGTGIDSEVEIFSMKQSNEHRYMELKKRGGAIETEPTTSSICGVRPWLAILNLIEVWISVRSNRISLWMLTSFLIMGIQMGEISKLGWLIGLFEQAIWAASLYFLYLLWLSISKIQDPVSETSCLFFFFLVTIKIRTMDKVQNPSNSVG
jgi:hypothetical protein